jgi:hypothetical protein
MKRLILPTSVLLIALLFVTCKKKSSDDSTPTPTCSDGIQNQGETGVDCGGPCTACQTVLCNGNGSASYFPLTLGNKWVYDFSITNSYTTCDTVTAASTVVYGGKTYFVCKLYCTPCGGGYVNYYFREDAATHDVYTWNGSTDVLYMPANPTVGQVLGVSTEIFTSGGNGRRVSSTTYTYTTPRCTYTNCVKIEIYNTSTGAVMSYGVYQKGIGPLRGGSTQQLKEISLH